MQGIRDVMARHHRSCDDLLAAAERAAANSAWGTALDAFARFREAMLVHFSAEESFLFPLFEQRTGIHLGPTQVMRLEHAQMRQLLAAAESALAAHDGEEYAGHAETLLIMMQQHNVKEENVLYPMCDEQLADQLEAIVQQLKQSIEQPGQGAE